MAHSILLIDKKLLFRQGLRALLAADREFVVAAEASDAPAALASALATAPQIVVVNLAATGEEGLGVAAAIKRRLPATRLVGLAAEQADELLHQALLVGMDAVLLEDAGYDDLLAALRSVVLGKKYLSAGVSGHLLDRLLEQQRPRSRASPLNELTRRERAILQLIAEGRSNRSVAEHLDVSPKTIEKHRANLMRKLGLRNASELMMAAVEMGLIERPGAVARLVDAHSS